MSEIVKKIVKAKKTTEYIINIDNYEETCHSKEHAESRLEELESVKQQRGRDFVIAEKLFEYKWINFCGKNYLVAPHIRKNRYMGLNEDGRLDGADTDGIFSYSMSDDGWRPPEYQKPENFLTLYTALVKRFVDIKFVILDTYVICELLSDREETATSHIDRKEAYWADGYLICLALQSAAADFAEANIKNL